MERAAFEFIEPRLEGGVLVLRVVVPMIRHPQAAQDFGAEARVAIQEHHARAVLLDMAAVEFLSSTGFAVLLGLARALAEAGGTLALAGLHEDVARGSSIIGLHRFASDYPNVPAALAALGAGAPGA